MTNVVEIRGLSRTYKQHKALDNVDLEIPEGCVLGLIGENGAGKTTLIRHILGLLKPESGQVSVFGRDPVAQPEVVLAEIGYLSEDRDLPAWMTVGQYLDFRAGFYPGWDHGLAKELLEQFRLDPSQRIASLSRGQHARAGLVAAVAFRPKLLLLDEPSSGLDPAVRHDILSTVIRAVNDQGRTVVFSSHLLDEVQQICDRVALILNGQLVVHDSLDEFLNKHWDWHVRFDQQADVSTAPALNSQPISDLETRFYTLGDPLEFEQWASTNGGQILNKRHPALEEIFVHFVRETGHTQSSTNNGVKQVVQ